MSRRCGARVGSGSVGGGKRHRVHHTNRLTESNGNVRSQRSEYHSARMFNNNLGVSHYISPTPDDAALSRAADPSVSLIPRHCSCPSVRMDSSTSSRHECASALTVLPLSTRLPMYCTKYWRGPSTEMSSATCRDYMT